MISTLFRQTIYNFVSLIWNLDNWYLLNLHVFSPEAGMWGAKPGLNLDFAKILMKRLIYGSIEMRESHGKGLDQLLLGRYVFPFLDGKFYQVLL